MGASKNPLARLLHIRDEIDAILSAFKGADVNRYRDDYLLQRGAERALLIISEAAKAVPVDVLRRYPEVDWRGVVQLGNVLRHEYPTVDSTVVWEIVSRKLPELRPVIDRMIRDLTR
jgi:uncharacterized protein with HEPN domain